MKSKSLRTITVEFELTKLKGYVAKTEEEVEIKTKEPVSTEASSLFFH
jgi:hypothetical protein